MVFDRFLKSMPELESDASSLLQANNIVWFFLEIECLLQENVRNMLADLAGGLKKEALSLSFSFSAINSG